MTINKLNGTECGTEIAKKINTIIDEKASVSLDNLDTDGQAILDGKVNSSDLFDANEHIKINKLQSYSMPSGSYTDLTPGASGTNYTAPADGWFIAQIINPNQWSNFSLTNTITSLGYILAFTTNHGAADYYTLSIPVKKGDIIKASYTGTLNRLRFVYAVGSQPA